MESTVLVTGATRFIGRRLVDRLLADGSGSGARVRALALPDEPARDRAAARAMAAVMERVHGLRGRPERPLLTTEAVVLLASRKSPPIDRAMAELGYRPMSYGGAMERVAEYIHRGVS